jgi:raffinose/stachyose/melibiose transport system permease protein
MKPSLGAVVSPARPRRGATRPDDAARAGSLARRRRRTGLLFLLPAAIINVLVIAGPALASVYYAFTDWSGFGSAHFTGLTNARRLIADPNFWNALRHNAQYMLFFLTVPVVMGLGGAFLLSRVRRFQMLFRVVFFIPYLMASVVNAAIWKNILDSDTGVAAQLGHLGVHNLDNVFFLGDTKYALYSVEFVDNWHFWGFLLVLFLAAMQSIDSERYEAARMDGASAWQEFWHITLPGIRPTLVFAMLIICLWSLLAYDYAYALTGGGPAASSDLMSLLVNRTAFGANEAGYAAFMGLTVSALGGVFLAVLSLLRRKGWDL